MKQFWIRISTRVDALTLRERIMLFAATLAAVVFLAYWMVLSPMFASQEALAAEISRQQDTIRKIEEQISAVARDSALDPDEANRERLAALQGDVRQLGADLRSIQESLVEPERIAPLLESMLRSNGKLRLVSLRTLPVTGVSEALPTGNAPTASAVTAENEQPGSKLQPSLAPADMAAAFIAQAKSAQAAQSAVPSAAPTAPIKLPELVYRHGVELTLEGGYLDMVSYMSQLEAMPVRLIWGRARLDASDHPRTRLTLTLFTLSLQKDWMKL